MNDSSKCIQRCTRCNLPANFPGINFDVQGVCSYCNSTLSSKEPEYSGVEALEKKVRETLAAYPNRSRKYDCVICLSGGRDSTYLLYWVKTHLKLNILALTLSHKFLPQLTIDNIKSITSQLGVDSVFIPNDYLDDCAQFFIGNWAKKPSAPALVNFCTGCRLGLSELVADYAKKQNIHLMFIGDTPFEKTDHKTRIVDINPMKPSKKGLIAGYAREVLKNPSYLSNPRFAFLQSKELRLDSRKKEYMESQGIELIAPFLEYMPWRQEDVGKVLEELHWQKNEKFAGEWRSDCYINMVRQYYYKRMLGFNDVDVYYAKAVRFGTVTTAQAIANASAVDEDISESVKEIMKDYFGADFDKCEEKISRICPPQST